MTPPACAVGLAIWIALVDNGPYWSALLAERDPYAAGTWLFCAAAFVMLVALGYLLTSWLMLGRIGRCAVGAVLVIAAVAGHYMERYGVFLDPTMVRNALRTEFREANELLTPALALHLLVCAAPPLVLLWRLHPAPTLRHRTVLRFIATNLLAVALAVLALLAVFSDYASLMRSQKEIRYLITPWNLVISTAVVAKGDVSSATRAREVVAPDAKFAPLQPGAKPPLMLIVVGETARAANWGLSGYGRQTTPALAKAGVINFADVSSCGTNTETSLPCMFALVGRRHYDEQRIRHSDSLLHVLSRAGAKVVWRDNQTGCKGVCAGLEEHRLTKAGANPSCPDGECRDAALLDGLDTIAGAANGPLVVVLHMLGNHGPAYQKRYPDEFRQWAPTCDTAELRECSREQIVNAYDNALLYTDHVVAGAISWLKTQSARFDTALIYVSDHGESLGEKGLYLHGVPWSIAPKEQTHVPMVWWLSPGFAASRGLDLDCIARRARQPAQHDHLFHTVASLLGVETQALEPEWDLTTDCRR